MKLFAVYVGGEAAGANIEIHDMRFVAAPSITDTYDELRRQWWGTPSSLHVDCWAEIDQVDGYDVILRPEPATGENRLYYVNLGGYDRGEFLEKHRNVFVVAGSLKEAKAEALKRGVGWKDLHRDDLYEAEQAFELDRFDGERRLYLHLEPTNAPREVAFICRYTPIGKV
ncbi:MAG: DUF1543 domain-containing protein [Sphingomonas sp.]|nr:DUF1543 domain-containing protein [Sphingomonas sp.]